MRCGGYLGDFAGEIRILDLQAVEEDFGTDVLVTWQGGGTRCGDVLGDYLGDNANVAFQVYVDAELRAVTSDNFIRVDIDPDKHSSIEVIGIASHLAGKDQSNAVEGMAGGGNQVFLAWTHDGTGDPSEFRIYWDAGDGETPDTLLETVEYETGVTNYTWQSDHLANGDYTFGLAAADAAGNETDMVLIGRSIYAPPRPPSNLQYTYTTAGREVTLTWTASPDL